MNTLNNIIRLFSSQISEGIKKMDHLTLNSYDSVESLDLLDESPYQAELPFNRYLPYTEKLNDEADKLLGDIKTNLARCVLVGDIDPGCIYWSNMLSKYISLYGLRFNKDEHIAFVKLFYELIILQNLPTSLIETFGSVLIALLKKKKLVSPKELELQWEPLYKLCEKIVSYNYKTWSPNRYPQSVETTLYIIVKKIKRYFPLSATQEILDELRPRIYPFNRKVMAVTFKLFEWFLPIQLPVEYHSIGHELWLHEFMKIWETCESVSHWEVYLMKILANLAKYNIGYIDWNPYIPIMFTRFIRNLKLPVCYKYGHSTESSLPQTAVAKWIISVLGNNSCAQTYFEKFLKTVESYFQPANRGSWTNKLNELFYHLVLNFAARLSREQYKKESWVLSIPESYKLSEENVDAFVNCMMPITMVAVFNYNISERIRVSLQHLALMRPNIVIPHLMEKLSLSLDTSIESHKFCTVVDSMSAICKPLTLGSRFHNKDHAYSEGPALVIPLLFSVLPGIDPNEPDKCYKALNLIWVISNLVPLVDCSRSKAEMSPQDQVLCDETSRFKEFLLQFMNKVFDLINSSSLDFSRPDGSSDNFELSLESITEFFLESTFESLLMQTNESTFMAALDKLSNFIMENNFEINVAGRLTATICGVFTQINSELTLKTLLPYLSQKIQNFISENEDILEEDNLNVNLLYSLHLFELLIIDSPGDQLLPYIDTIINMLDKTTCLKNYEGSVIACESVDNLLNALTSVQDIGLDKSYDDPNYPYWNDWGKSVDFNNVKVKWYIPGEKEMAAAEKVFRRFFIPATELIQDHISGKKPLARNDLQRNLRLIVGLIAGVENVLPEWSEPAIVMKNCENCTLTFKPTIGNEKVINMPNGDNIRLFLIKMMEELQALTLKNEEDDIKSLSLIVLIWEILSVNKTQNFHEMTDHFTSTRNKKKDLGDKITRDKGYVPRIFLLRVRAQHELRKTQATFALTPTSKVIFKNLFKLCISKYASVRVEAQSTLWMTLNDYTNSYQLIIDDVLKVLDLDPEKNPDVYKGVLYAISADPKSTCLKNGDWEALSNLLPALVLSKPSEKPSIINQLQNITKVIPTSYHAISFELNLSDSCLAAASNLWDSSGVKLTLTKPSKNEIENGLSTLKYLNDSKLKAYNDIFEKLSIAMTEKNLNSRHRAMAMQFIDALTHKDYPLPKSVVTHFLHALISDSLRERKLAWSVISKCLKQLKRKCTKETKLIKNPEKDIKPGRRVDNEWLQYNSKTFPKSVAEWEEPRYMHNHWVGYYTWPKEVKIFAPTLLQPSLDKNSRNLSYQEKEIDLFFSNEENVRKFIEFLALEEKGKNEFNFNRYLLFKGLFQNFGDAYLSIMLPHLKRLVETKQESSHQRCAAEMICGIICGSKHWSYPMTANMWNKLLPIIKIALDNIMEETLHDWMVCFVEIQINRDPTRLYWLIEFFIEDVQKIQTSSRIECAKLKILQCLIRNQVWRLSDVLKRLQPIIEARLLDNPFDSVRDSLASTLVVIYNSNLSLSSNLEDQIKQQSHYPQMEDFVKKMYPKLEILLDEQVSKSESSTKATRFLNTMCAFIRHTEYSHVGLVPCFYTLYNIISQMEIADNDKELASVCSKTLAVLARFWTKPEYVPIVLETIDSASKSSSWLMRVSNTEFLQVWLFHNMSTVLSNERYITTVRDIILRLLEDTRVEVRENAAKVLTGMLHCSILPNEQGLLEKFKEMGKTRLHKRKRMTDNFNYNNAIRLRHTAVLGMCAFIQAHPYDLPDSIPPIFEYLNNHLNDPAPIPATIRNTLNNFKRTHCDGWTGLQGLANIMTPEQYTFLQDLTVAPSYYA